MAAWKNRLGSSFCCLKKSSSGCVETGGTGLTFVEMLMIVLGAVHTSQISEICVIFIVFTDVDTDGQREITCPRSHGQGLKLLFLPSLSD